jgi:hypothetical protein
MNYDMVSEVLMQFSARFLTYQYSQQCELYEGRLANLKAINWDKARDVIAHEVEGIPEEERLEAVLRWMETVVSD